MDPDQDLVAAVRAGDEDAFAALLRRYQRQVFNLARLSVRNEADADDAAQEVFIKVFRGLPTFRGDSSFRTWLYRVAVNVLRTRAAGPGLFGRATRIDTVDQDGAGPLDVLAGPDDVESDVARREAIDGALRQLPRELREAVTLRDIEGLEYREIAAALDIPVGTVMSRIARGRARLRPLLAGLLAR